MIHSKLVANLDLNPDLNLALSLVKKIKIMIKILTRPWLQFQGGVQFHEGGCWACGRRAKNG